jgi:hypothetical protein
MRTQLTEVAVPADSVVENLDVVEHIRPCLLALQIDPPSNPLFLQAAEKRFRHSIVVAVAPATHAGDKTMILANPHRVVASVLGPLVGVNNHRPPGLRRLHPCVKPAPLPGTPFGHSLDQGVPWNARKEISEAELRNIGGGGRPSVWGLYIRSCSISANGRRFHRLLR